MTNKIVKIEATGPNLALPGAQPIEADPPFDGAWQGTILLLALTSLALALPALWNGYPLLYHDTEDYVSMSFTWAPPLWRTLPYAVIVALARPFGSLWMVVLVQALFGAWVLQELFAAFLPQTSLARRGVGQLILVASTALPWVTSEAMPDAFSGFVPIILAILAFGEGLPRWRKVILMVAGGIAIMTHLSHVGVAVGLAVILLALRLAAPVWRFLPRPAVGFAMGSILLGCLAVPSIHWVATGRPFLSRGGQVLQLALFVQNGLAQRYLDRVCPQGAALSLCPYRDHLPDSADAFLWAPWASPFWKLGGWSGMRDEATTIVEGTIHTFPHAVAAAAIANSWTQYWSIDLGDGLDPKNRPHDPGEYYDVGRSRFPKDFAQYLAARQQTGDGIHFRALNRLLVPLAVLGRAMLLLSGWLAVRRGDRRGAGLAVIFLMALFGNAVLCGAVSNPHDRYQNRVVWIASAGALLLGGRQWEAFNGQLWKRQARDIEPLRSEA